MSRIQKKKPLGEKSKKRDESENKANSSGNPSTFSNSKSVAQTSSLKAKPEKSPAEVSEPNFFQKAMDFLREVKVELKKVTWPTQKQTTGTTIVVIIFVFIVSAFLGLFDLGLSKLVQVVLT